MVSWALIERFRHSSLLDFSSVSCPDKAPRSRCMFDKYLRKVIFIHLLIHWLSFKIRNVLEDLITSFRVSFCFSISRNKLLQLFVQTV